MKNLPKIPPLTLTRLRQPFDDPDWIFELKHDGFRGVAYISVGKCKLVSRNASAKWIKIKNPNYTQAERRHELFAFRYVSSP